MPGSKLLLFMALNIVCSTQPFQTPVAALPLLQQGLDREAVLYG